MISDRTQIWLALDLVAEACAASGTPEWKQEWRDRTRKSPRRLPDDLALMRRMAVAIAYSQGSRSSVIRDLVREPVFAEAFAQFDPGRLARKKPATIRRLHWHELSSLRFRSKIDRIVACASVLNGISREFGSFADYLLSFEIPRRLRTPSEVDQFWSAFDRLRADLRGREMPFFRSTTSLLQLLLDLDYDSVKPDLIVMRLARRIGMTDRELGEKHLRAVAREVQDYAIRRGVRAQAVDLEMLALGGQTGARLLLSERFCPPSDPCRHTSCSLGRKGLCKASQSA